MNAMLLITHFIFLAEQRFDERSRRDESPTATTSLLETNRNQFRQFCVVAGRGGGTGAFDPG